MMGDELRTALLVMQTWVEGSLDKLKSNPGLLGAWNKRY